MQLDSMDMGPVVSLRTESFISTLILTFWATGHGPESVGVGVQPKVSQLWDKVIA